MMSTIIKWWLIAIVFFLLLYLVSVRRINWRGLFGAIAEAVMDIACHLWIDICAVFPRRKRRREIKLDEYEKRLS